MKNYKLLEKEFEEIGQINNIISIIYWDIAVNIPKFSTDSRINEIALLNSIIHSRITSNKVKELIDASTSESNELDNWQITNLTAIKDKVAQTECITDELSSRYIQASAKCELVWREARNDNDFEKVKPFLQEVLNILHEVADAKASVLKCSQYDALINDYDKLRKASDIKNSFTILKEKLPNLISNIIDKQSNNKIIPISVPISMQKDIGIKIMQNMGFDFNMGRLDDSTHPFCGGSPFDIRITNRYDKDNFISGIMGIVHETGHGLYEMNLPINYKNQPVGKANGMALHESQSLFMEMQVGRSRQFSNYLSKLLHDKFNLKGEEFGENNLYNTLTQVKRSFIRVDADEVTYPMHVILRFEIEELLMNKDITVNDIPTCWNDMMHKYLNIKPQNNKQGCLQDIHWYSGAIGYFPAYTNGAIIASMLMKKLKSINNNINTDIINGNFINMNEFLNNNIRKFGSLKTTKDLINDATGYDISPHIFLEYIEEKYL